MMVRSLIPATLLLCLLPLLVGGCLLPQDEEIAAQIEGVLRQQFHPDKVSVTFERSSTFSTTIRALDITMSGFTLQDEPKSPKPGPPKPAAAVSKPARPKGPQGRLIHILNARIHCQDFTVHQLPVNDIELALKNIRVPLGNLKAGQVVIASADAVAGSVTFSEEGLTKFLRTNTLPLSEPTIRLRPDNCVLSGKTRTFISVPIELTGKIAVRDKAVLYLDDPKLEVSAVTLPGSVTDRLLKDVNPLIDLNTLRLPAPLTITRAEHLDRAIRFDAVLDFPKTSEHP